MEVTSMEVTSMEVTSNKLGKQCTHVILCMIDYCFVKLRLTCFVAHHALCLGKCNGCCHRCYGKQRNPMSRYIVLHTHRLVVFSVFTLNTIRNEPSVKLVLVILNVPISFVDSTC